jgi:hypothetical protein
LLRSIYVKSWSKTWFFVAMIISLMYCWSRDKSFVSLDADAIVSDGYASQVAYIFGLIEAGGTLLDAEPLYWIHGIRALIALAFSEVYSFGGALLTVVLILACIWPLFELFNSGPRSALALVLPLAVTVLSYRAVLVFVAIGYLLLYIVHRRSLIYLVISFLLVNLSSGAVLSAMMITLLLSREYRRVTPMLVIFSLLLMFSLGVSFADKYTGFLAQDAGYDATIQGATGIMALLSRSTVFVSIMAGDYVRAFAYIGMFFGACYALVYATLKKPFAGYAVIFVATTPAFFLEGLGVISLVVPVLMFLAGVPLPRRLNVESRPNSPIGISGGTRAK